MNSSISAIDYTVSNSPRIEWIIIIAVIISAIVTFLFGMLEGVLTIFALFILTDFIKKRLTVKK